MEQSRQRMHKINIGIIDVRGQMFKRRTLPLVDWILTESIAILTGFFGTNKIDFVSTLAECAGAIGSMPFFEGVSFNGEWSDGKQLDCYTYPSYFLLFGFYKSMLKQFSYPCLPDWFECAEEIMLDMVEVNTLPSWVHNDVGSAYVPHHGSIKQKPVDFLDGPCIHSTHVFGLAHQWRAKHREHAR